MWLCQMLSMLLSVLRWVVLGEPWGLGQLLFLSLMKKTETRRHTAASLHTCPQKRRTPGLRPPYRHPRPALDLRVRPRSWWAGAAGFPAPRQEPEESQGSARSPQAGATFEQSITSQALCPQGSPACSVKIRIPGPKPRKPVPAVRAGPGAARPARGREGPGHRLVLPARSSTWAPRVQRARPQGMRTCWGACESLSPSDQIAVHTPGGAGLPWHHEAGASNAEPPPNAQTQKVQCSLGGRRPSSGWQLSDGSRVDAARRAREGAENSSQRLRPPKSR